MKIDSPFGPLTNAKETKKTGESALRPAPPELEAPKPEENGPGAGDVVRLSERARLAARATELAHAAPDVRRDKVDSLKSRLSAGAYDVSGRVVAEALLRKSITEV